MAASPFDKLRALLPARRPKRRVIVVVQTSRGQVAVPADVLRDHLRKR
jgi:hypothetical protein